jgi:hypothetical protein
MRNLLICFAIALRFVDPLFASDKHGCPNAASRFPFSVTGASTETLAIKKLSEKLEVGEYSAHDVWMNDWRLSISVVEGRYRVKAWLTGRNKLANNSPIRIEQIDTTIDPGASKGNIRSYDFKSRDSEVNGIKSFSVIQSLKLPGQWVARTSEIVLGLGDNDEVISIRLSSGPWFNRKWAALVIPVRLSAQP